MRLDKTELSPARTARIYEGWIARTHDSSHPLVYGTGDEYRDEAELLNILEQAKTLSLPVTLHHPPGLIAHDAKPENYVGKVFDAYLDGDHVVARFIIERDEGVNAIEVDGIIELSLGYQARKDDNSYQRDIKLNHLSLVPRGRCGTCELNPHKLDCEADYRREVGGLASAVPSATLHDMAITIDPESLKSALASVLGELVVKSEPQAEACGCHKDGAETVTPDEVASLVPNDIIEAQVMDKEIETLKAALEAANAKVASLEADLAKKDEMSSLAAEKAEAKAETEKTRADGLVAELEAAKAALEAAKTARSDAEESDFAARVDARVDLLAKADAVEIENARSMKDVEIKLAVIKKIRNKDVKSDASAAYIDGMFDIAMEQFEAAKQSLAAVRGAIVDHEDNAAIVIEDPLAAEKKIAAEQAALRKDNWKK